VIALVDVSRELALLIALALAPAELREAQLPAPVRRLERLVFTDQSWLECVSREGAEIGLAPVAARIFKTSAGRYYVPVPSEHAAILALRDDASVAPRCLMARARRLGDAIGEGLARPATAADVYLAHVLGLEPALRVLRAAAATPSRPAIEVAPTEAVRRADLFFASGRARAAGDVKRMLEHAVALAAGREGARLSAAVAERRAAAVAWHATITRAQ